MFTERGNATRLVVVLALGLAGSASAETIYLHETVKAKSAACPYGGERDTSTFSKLSIHVASPDVVLWNGRAIEGCSVVSASNWTCDSFASKVDGKLVGPWSTEGCYSTQPVGALAYWTKGALPDLGWWYGLILLGLAFGPQVLKGLVTQIDAENAERERVMVERVAAERARAEESSR